MMGTKGETLVTFFDETPLLFHLVLLLDDSVVSGVAGMKNIFEQLRNGLT